MRRENGTGSISKLSGKRRKPYMARISNGYDNGVKKWIIIGCYATKKEAANALANFASKPVSDKYNVKFHELYKEFSDLRFEGLSDAARRSYKCAYNNVPSLHNKKMREIKTADIQFAINNIHLKIDSLRLVKALLSMLFKFAMQQDIVDRNYAQYILLPKQQKKERAIFTDDEIDKLWRADSPSAEILLMLIYSGMRIQELLNLTTNDVHIKERYIIGGEKTEAGKERVIPIHSKTLHLWEKWTDGKTGYIFCNNGRLITQHHYREYMLYPLEEELGIEKKTPHAARHTTASLLAREGANPNYIKTILGHTSYAFTADVYTHAQTDELIKAIEKI